MVAKISVAIITKNEEKNISFALGSCNKLDEIIVLDGNSTDKTSMIASAYGARVATQSWLGFGRQKNKAVSLTTNEWVFSLDSDESMSEELLQSILTASLTDKTIAFAIKRQSYFLGKKIRFSGWQNDWVLRLFNKRSCQFEETEVHEKIVGFSRVKKLKGVLYHHPYKTKDQVESKIINYSLLGAIRRIKEKKPRKIPVFPAVWAFIKTFVIQLGFCDGIAGWQLASMNFRYTFRKYKIQQELQRSNSKKLSHK